jgi:hypothetical protein
MNNHFNAKTRRSKDAGKLNSFNPLCVLAASRLGVEFPSNYFTNNTHH